MSDKEVTSLRRKNPDRKKSNMVSIIKDGQLTAEGKKLLKELEKKLGRK